MGLLEKTELVQVKVSVMFALHTLRNKGTRVYFSLSPDGDQNLA